MTAHFIERDGLIHLIGIACGGEFTLCGDAFDAYVDEPTEIGKWVETNRRIVTCEKCAREILNCRGVRIAKGLRP